MKLVIGGYAQGKLEYVLGELERKMEGDAAGAYMVWDGVLPEKEETEGKRIVLNHFHSWVRERIRQEGSPEEEALAFVEEHPDCIIICDEIGNGIVPVDGFEREYRERTGRILVKLAEKAEEVIRVICGMGQKIK